MAITTCKKFTYAKVSGGGDGSAMSYTGGTMLEDYLAKVDINEERTDEKEYADGHLIDSEKIPTGVTMAMELVNNNDNIRKDVLGMAHSRCRERARKPGATGRPSSMRVSRATALASCFPPAVR